MSAAFDQYGFLTLATIPDRITTVDPPSESEWPAGQRPNWTGHAWMYLDYPPAPTPPPVPGPITDLQIRLALTKLGMRKAVEAAVAAGSQDLRDWWDRSLELHRDNLLVAEMIAAIGATPEQADAVWVLGATL